MTNMKQTIWLVFWLILSSAFVAAEEVRVADSESLARALRAAKAGDVILLAAGKYRGGMSHSGLAGAADKPIVIAGADAKDPPIFEGGGSGLHLSSIAHVELRDLVFRGATGNGLNIDDGGKAESPSHHVVLRNLVVGDVGPRGNCDGIKLSGVDALVIKKCRVERWGSAGSAIDMVGCHDGVVKQCHFSEATSDLANAVQTKGGCRDILIQQCRFEHCGGRGVNAGGSTGSDYFRPRNATYEAKEITIEDCTFRGGLSAIAFVGVDGAVARHNTIYCPSRWAIRILQENTSAGFAPCRNVKFENNLIAFRSSDVSTLLNIGGNTSPETFEFAGNVWCCLDRPSDARRLVRLPVAEKGGVYDVAPLWNDAEAGDLSLKEPLPHRAGVR